MFPPAVQSWAAAGLCAKRQSWRTLVWLQGLMEHFLHPMYFASVSLLILFTEPTRAMRKPPCGGWAKNLELDLYPLQVNSVGLYATGQPLIWSHPVPTILVGDSGHTSALGTLGTELERQKVASAPKTAQSVHRQAHQRLASHMQCYKYPWVRRKCTNETKPQK